MDKIRRHIIFYGYVQGVGFRWKAKNTAHRLGISGWVRNLDNGSVDMIEALENHSWGSIERMEAENIPVHGDYEFEVK